MNQNSFCSHNVFLKNNFNNWQTNDNFDRPFFFKLLIIVVSTKCAAAGYITGKKRRVIWHRGENDQCNWQLQQVALTTYPRHSKFVPVKGSDCSHRIVFTSTNEFSLIYTVIFPLSLPAKYSQFNSNPRIYATAS